MKNTYESICKQIGNNWGEQITVFTRCRTSNSACCATHGTTSAPRPRVRGGRDLLLCHRGEQHGQSGAAARPHPCAGRFGRARPTPEPEQASAVAAPSTPMTPSRPRNPRAPVPAPTPCAGRRCQRPRTGGRARTPVCTRHPCTGKGRGKGRRRRRRPVERRAQPAAHCDAHLQGRGRCIRVPAHACTRTRSLRE
jgi:hypothetical protein